MFAACTDGVGKAWASSLVGPALQGRAQGIYQGFTGMAIVIAGVWAGLAWHGTGVVPLLISGIVASLFALWLWVAPPDRLRAMPCSLTLSEKYASARGPWGHWVFRSAAKRECRCPLHAGAPERLWPQAVNATASANA